MSGQNSLFPNGTHQIFEAPSMRLLTAMSLVNLLKGWAKTASTSVRALLRIELDTFVMKA